MTPNSFISPISCQLGEGTGTGILAACIHGDAVISLSNSTSLQTLRTITLPANALSQAGDCVQIFAAGSMEALYLDQLIVDFGGIAILAISSGSVFAGEFPWVLDMRVFRLTSGGARATGTIWMAPNYPGTKPQFFSYLSGVDFTANQDCRIRTQISDTAHPFKVEVSNATVYTRP